MEQFLIADTSRIGPSEIPRDRVTFRNWADAACVEWPPELTRMAYEVVAGVPPAFNEEAYNSFIVRYADWFFLTEPQKELRMTAEQVDSPIRATHRVQARKAI